MNEAKEHFRFLRELDEYGKKRDVREYIYTSEYLGYLPFGWYHWLETADGVDISNQLATFASGLWLNETIIHALAAKHLIEIISETKTFFDDGELEKLEIKFKILSA